MLNYDLRLVFLKLNKNLRFCGAGEMTRCYDLDGDVYPCQGFAPVALGKEAETYKDYDVKKFDLTTNNPCVRCKFFFLCANCYSANLAITGCCHLVDINQCMAYRMCILASSKIQFERIKMKKELTNDDWLVLKAISIIQSEIANDESPLKGITNHVCNPNCRCN